jgi:hypothetical protein
MACEAVGHFDCRLVGMSNFAQTPLIWHGTMHERRKRTQERIQTTLIAGRYRHVQSPKK